MTGFHTQSAYISGVICGPMWAGPLGGIPVTIGLEHHRVGVSFRDMLLHALKEKGGDFKSAKFTVDSVIRVERVKVVGSMRTIHEREREIADIKGCDDLVDADAYSGDFLYEGD